LIEVNYFFCWFFVVYAEGDKKLPHTFGMG
jgi:hypothetical protein